MWYTECMSKQSKIGRNKKKIERFKAKHPEGRKEYARSKRLARAAKPTA